MLTVAHGIQKLQLSYKSRVGSQESNLNLELLHTFERLSYEMLHQ
jgi:hypothetical protein